ncbi:hypothetical protein PENSPDRAFT_691100 [Peniophora sp. CONT]|nr:hypothetical protein PENSPDRAFT_691100 [Peniophora sp. CONT]
MSFLTHIDGRRIVDDYPPAAVSLAEVFFDKDSAEAEPWRCIPRDIDLSEWIRVQPWKRRTPTIREHRVLFTDAVRRPSRPNNPWSVSLSLYGFIDSMNLSLTGNWDLQESSAPKAVQFVRLCGGTFPAPFQAQADALVSLEQHITGMLRGGGLPVQVQDAMVAQRRRSLFVGRRVFEKVSATTAPSIPVSGPATQLVNKWRITSTAKLGFRDDDLQLKSCTAAKFSPGDFVQAIVKYVVVSKDMKRHEPPQVSVHLNLISLVRLVAARHVPQVMPALGVTMMEDPIEESMASSAEENIDEGPPIY